MLNLKPFQPPPPKIIFKPPREWLPRLRALLDTYPQDGLSSTEALCCRIVGDFTAGIVLHRLLFWITRGCRDDGAIWKSDDEWKAELTLTYSQMRRVREKLEPVVDSWVEKAQGAPTCHYQLRLDALIRSIATVLNCSTFDIRLSILDSVENAFSEESKMDFRKSRKSLTNQHQTLIPIDERLKIFHPYLDRFVGFNAEIAAKLSQEYSRIGEANTNDVLARCNRSNGKSWQYVLRSLENVSAPIRTPIPLYGAPAGSPSLYAERGLGGEVSDQMRLAWASSDEGRSWAARLDSARNPKPAALPKAPASREAVCWDRAYSQLEIQLDRASFDTWLRAAHFLNSENGVFHIAVANTYARDMLQHRMYRDIRRVLTNIVGQPVELLFEVHKPAPVQDDVLPAFKLLALEHEAHEAEMAFYKTLSSKEGVNDLDANPERAGLVRKAVE